MPDKRTIRVLAALVVGMTVVSSILLLLEPQPGFRNAALSLSAVERDNSESAREKLLKLSSPADWQYIIIHDSRGVSGSEKDLNAAWGRWYASQGQSATRDAGYHFVIDDGDGVSDGELEIAHRWTQQYPGDFISGEQADLWNRQSIGICIMGDADTKSFSDDQIDATVWLVRELQQAFNIPRERVIVHTGRSPESLSPFFPASEFRRMIRD